MMVMGLQRQQQILLFQRQRQARDDGFGGLSFVKVMTDDQIELLRKQIAVYAVISEQLLEMHKSLTAQQDLAGMRVGNVYCDPLMGFGGQKMSTRQRWTPAAVQLQVLESIFDEGNGTPCKQRIKDIAMELSQHGPISETNVYNWFQNRRARSKRRHSGGPTPPNNAESVEEPQVESPKDKDSSHNSAPRAQNMYLQSPERGTQMEAHSGITSSTSLALVRVMPTPRFGNFRR